MDKKIGWLVAGIVAFVLLSSFLAFNLTAKNGELNQAIQDHSKAIDAKDAEINLLTEDLGETNVELDDLKFGVGELQKEFDNTKTELANTEKAKTDLELEKDTIIAELEEQLAEEESTEAMFEAGYLLDDIVFGGLVKEILDDSELDKFFDGKIEFNENDYNTHEEFNIRTTPAINGLSFDKEFYGNPYFILEKAKDLAYKYVFDDVIAFEDVTESEPLYINFLGMPLSIVDVTRNEIEIKQGKKIFLKEGDSYVINEKELVLLMVGWNEIMVSYNNDQATIAEGDSKKIGGLDIKAEEVLSNNYNGVATLLIGEDVLKTIKNGHEWVEDDERFIFEIYTTDEDLDGFGIVYDIKSDEADDDFPPLAVGDEILFPNGYLSVLFESITEVEYAEITLSFDDFDVEDDLQKDTNMVVLEASEDIFIVDNEELDEVYLSRTFGSWNIYYYNEDNYLTEATTTELSIEFEDTEFAVTLENVDDKNIVFANLSFDVRSNGLKLGNIKEEAEDNDILYIENSYGTLDGDLLTKYGIIVKDVEDNANDDEVKISIPSEQVFANLFVS